MRCGGSLQLAGAALLLFVAGGRYEQGNFGLMVTDLFFSAVLAANGVFGFRQERDAAKGGE